MERNIYGYKCKKCGTINYPHRSLCKKCHNDIFEDYELVALPKTGKLLTYTHLHNPTADYDVPILHLGIVELENGNRITGQLNISNPKIGMKVKGEVDVVRKTEYDKYYGMIFSEE